MRLAITAGFFAISLGCAISDEAEEGYKAGYARGYDDGYALGFKNGGGTTLGRGRPVGDPGTIILRKFEIEGGTPGTVMIPGQNFAVTIDPAQPDKPFSFNPDSSVAIIPRSAVDEIKQKMGADFVQENMILNNVPAQ